MGASRVFRRGCPRGAWLDRRLIPSGDALNAGARAAATQHAAKQVLWVLDIGEKIDLAAGLRVVAKQVVQEPQRGEILERESHRVEYRHFGRCQ